MKEQAIQLLSNYGHEIVFLHVLSAIIWVGGMIAIRFAVHPTIQSIEEPNIKLSKILMLIGKFFNIVLPFIIILLLTAVILGSAATQSADYEIKFFIWSVMTANFTWMYFKRRKAQRLFHEGKLPEAKASIVLIPKLLLPINIFLGIVSLWLGVGLRGV